MKATNITFSNNLIKKGDLIMKNKIMNQRKSKKNISNYFDSYNQLEFITCFNTACERLCKWHEL